MPIWPAWTDIAIRLACAFLAGALIGFDRGEHGRAAGLRTTILVSLAACVAMLQANVLMPTAGKAGNSFVVLDLMRLPLGILSGMGFIGAGVILRKDDRILGVTTAATLWLVTVLGLCFGGGQYGIGFAGLACAWIVISALRPLEARLHKNRRATLTLVTTAAGPSAGDVRDGLQSQGYTVVSCGLIHTVADENDEWTYQLDWRASGNDTGIPEIVRTLSARPGVLKIIWRPSQ